MENETVKKLKKSKEYKTLEKFFKERCEKQTTNKQLFQSKAKEYLSMWIDRELLDADIKENGVTSTYDNGGGQTGIRTNPSVEKKLKVNAQMDKCLSVMKIDFIEIVEEPVEEEQADEL